MASSTSDPDRGRRVRPPSAPDPDTDPGRPHPYESLYRSAPGDEVQPSRPTPRHFVPHLSRPDGAQEGFGWLFRDEEPPVDPAAAQPTTPNPTTSNLDAAVDPTAAETRVRSPTSPATPPLTAYEPDAPPPRGRRRRLVVLLVVLVVLVLAGIAYVVLHPELVGATTVAGTGLVSRAAGAGHLTSR